jgi:hypothetical protein
MRNKLLFLIIAILTCPCAMFAQNPNYDRCDVRVTAIGRRETRSLGAFDTVIGEEERTVKAFALPGTKLFVVASVFYTDESMGSQQGSDSVSLELTLSRNRQRNVLRSLSFADAEMPSTVDVGRVTMLIKVNHKRQFIIMECRRHSRR